MPVYNAKSLEQRQVFLFHDENMYKNEVDKLMNECLGCQKQLGMNVKHIEKIPIHYPRHANKNGQQVDDVI